MLVFHNFQRFHIHSSGLWPTVSFLLPTSLLLILSTSSVEQALEAQLLHV
jgi:hypothetical protein